MNQEALYRQTKFNDTHEACKKCGEIVERQYLDANGLCPDCVIDEQEKEANK